MKVISRTRFLISTFASITTAILCTKLTAEQQCAHYCVSVRKERQPGKYSTSTLSILLTHLQPQCVVMYMDGGAYFQLSEYHSGLPPYFM